MNFYYDCYVYLQLFCFDREFALNYDIDSKVNQEHLVTDLKVYQRLNSLTDGSGMSLLRKTCNPGNICVVKNEQHCGQHGHLLDVDVKGSKISTSITVIHSKALYFPCEYIDEVNKHDYVRDGEKEYVRN